LHGLPYMRIGFVVLTIIFIAVIKLFWLRIHLASLWLFGGWDTLKRG